MKIHEVIVTRDELRQQIRDEHTRHAQRLTGLERDLAYYERLIDEHAQGNDVARIQMAETVLEVFGRYDASGDQLGAVEQSIRDVAAGGAGLFTQFRGTKNYAHWISQREDHAYGMGPRHGSTNFSIGIRSERRVGGPELTDDERDACIYYLQLLKSKRLAGIAA